MAGNVIQLRTKDGATRIAESTLIVDVEGFEGPLDLLLSLARAQKVDLARISILRLVEQYAQFVRRTKALRIELAADYLVMAAWLALLKSRLLVPKDCELEESEDELAARLRFRLRKLQAMRSAAQRIMERDRLGQQFFGRGQPEDVIIDVKHEFSVSVLELMQAYARSRSRDDFRPRYLERPQILSVEEALKHLKSIVGAAIDWSDLSEFLPEGWHRKGGELRSAKASVFVASLELAKSGAVELRQMSPFGPVQLKRRHSRHDEYRR